MTATVCPTCHHLHTTRDAVAVGRFRNRTRNPATAYIAHSGGPLRSTRIEAEADECAARTRRNQGTPPPDPAPAPQPQPQPQPQPTTGPPAPFPAAEYEQAARAKAWQDFLTQTALSLTIWRLDPTIHHIEPPLDWLTRCATELHHHTHPQATNTQGDRA